MNLLGSYINGNYKVSIFEDGTKIRANKLDCFIPDKPESMDIKITNQCECNCPFCHENSTPDGLHGDILNAPFIDTLLPYTELAIGGGNPLCHPDLLKFLHKLKEQKLIANITVNQKHFVENQDMIKALVEDRLIYGLGISLTSVTKSFLALLKQYPNAVVHMINGIATVKDFMLLADNDIKILILGYKRFRRGADYFNHDIETNKTILYYLLPKLIERFKAVSFDNLALTQLNVKRLMSAEKWNDFYMGGDGQFTMYVDMVKREFATSSIATNRFSLLEDIKPMFDKVRTESKK